MDNVVPLRPQQRTDDDWSAIVAQELQDIREEIVLTNSLLMKLLRVLKEVV